MKKKFVRVGLIAFVALLLVAIAGALYMNWMMKQPLYHFGDAAAAKNLRSSLEPPEQQNNLSWQVETDVNLHVDSFGDGTAALVIHGGPGIPYATQWKGLGLMTDRYQFFYYHQRGCGNSTRPFDRFEGSYYENMTMLERTLGLGAQIADIERIRKILGKEKLTLVGHSYGGFIAALYAAEFPNRVEKLVLVAPAGVLTPPDEERNLFELARKELSADELADYDDAVEQYLDFGNLFSNSDSELVDIHMRVGRYLLKAMGYSANDFEDAPRSGGWAVFAVYFSTGRAQDYRPALQAITAPTIIVVGEDDKFAIAGSKTYQRIPNSKLVIVKRDDQHGRSGHFVYDDSPTLFGKTVEEFLTE